MSTERSKSQISARWMLPFAVICLGPFAPILLLLALTPRSRRSREISFAQIKLRFPALGMFHSAIIHLVILVCFFMFPLAFESLNPPRIVEVRWDDVRFTPLNSPEMKTAYYPAETEVQTAPASIRSGKEHLGPKSPRETGKTKTAPSHHVQGIYSGPQEIVSTQPNPTNSIQTILRPDLFNPPVLDFPLLLKPVVILRSSNVAASKPNPMNTGASPASNQHVNSAPVQMQAAETAAPLPSPAADRKVKALPAPQVEPEIPATDAVSAIVLNAITVPENAPIALPQAQLSGSFAVRPLKPAGGADVSDDSVASSAGRGEAEKLPQRRCGVGAVVRPSKTLTQKTDSVLNPTTAGDSNANRSSQLSAASHAVETPATGQPAGRAFGITIIGGTSRESSALSVSATSSKTPASYGLTVISSGSSGGASRDSGYFDRRETVYTVYLPMADAGGGPDWSIQYAILGPPQAGNGLLTPPVAVKKIPAVVAGDLPDSPPPILFFSAVISATGELTVNLPSHMDPRRRQALDALLLWKFLPARINGIAVGVKVLFGVGVLSR
jgi:hypothetical protein